MLIALLGPLEVSVNGAAVPVSGARLRTLLARLAVDAGRGVSGAELVEAVWGEQPPAESGNALQTLVSRLRRALGGADTVAQLATGYRLVDADTDVARFYRLLELARTAAGAGDLTAAAAEYQAALALWRGEPLAEQAEADWLRAPAARWQDDRLAAVAARIDCQLQLGQAAVVIGELEQLCRLYPLREQFTQLLMTALVATGRPAEALVAFERQRTELAEQLGVDPSAELRQAHLAVLNASDATRAPQPAGRDGHRTNLRAGLTSFLGREVELARLSTLLDSGRLATVVGPGGAGKTRLAGVAAGQWLDRLADGVWLVELAPVTDPANLDQTVLSSLGIWADHVLERTVELGRRSPAEQLVELLADAECLVVVDNCEHLIGPVAELVARLLGACPRLRVLATSREPLGIDGEALCLIAPLSLPALDANPAEAAEHASVQLFADRATAVSAEFRIDATTVGPVVRIVRRLDGLPLAIELAAARLRVLPVTEIADRLSDRFRLLTGGSRAALPRHRTLRAVVEWSWDLLTEQERLLAERLAIFPSGASVASAEAVCTLDRIPVGEVPELLSALVDKSLLKVDSAGGLRYQMLETIREYGIERLAERDELPRLRLAHARLFSELCIEQVNAMRGGDQLEHLRELQLEWDNVLAALGYLAEVATAAGPTDESAEAALRTAYALSWYWVMLGRHTDATYWLTTVLQATKGSSSPIRLLVEAMHELNSAAASFGSSGPDEGSSGPSRLDELFDELAALDADVDPMLPLLQSILTFFTGRHDQSAAALAPALSSPDRWVRASALMFQAHIHENAGDLASMRVDAEASLKLFREIGDRWGMASTGAVLAQLQMLDADLTGAIASYELAADYLREFGAISDESMLHLQLAELYLRIGDVAAAKDRVARSRNADFQLGGRAQRLMVDAAQATIALVENDKSLIGELRDRIAVELAQLRPGNPMNGHVMAIALSRLAELLVATDRVAEAGSRLTEAYRYGIGVHDMPIMAVVSLAVAGWAQQTGAPVEAAQILGAAAQLRGAPDPTDPLGQRLNARLVAELGEQHYCEEFAAGQQLSRDEALARVSPESVTHPRQPEALNP